ncbi:hypothetical protein EJB05_15646, partial [Eragrostis curvula]
MGMGVSQQPMPEHVPSPGLVSTWPDHSSLMEQKEEQPGDDVVAGVLADQRDLDVASGHHQLVEPLGDDVRAGADQAGPCAVAGDHADPVVGEVHGAGRIHGVHRRVDHLGFWVQLGGACNLTWYRAGRLEFKSW